MEFSLLLANNLLRYGSAFDEISHSRFMSEGEKELLKEDQIQKSMDREMQDRKGYALHKKKYSGKRKPVLPQDFVSGIYQGGSGQRADDAVFSFTQRMAFGGKTRKRGTIPARTGAVAAMIEEMKANRMQKLYDVRDPQGKELVLSDPSSRQLSLRPDIDDTKKEAKSIEDAQMMAKAGSLISGANLSLRGQLGAVAPINQYGEIQASLEDVLEAQSRQDSRDKDIETNQYALLTEEQLKREEEIKRIKTPRNFTIEDERGNQLEMRCPSIILFVGPSEKGKTYLLRHILLSMWSQNYFKFGIAMIPNTKLNADYDYILNRTTVYDHDFDVVLENYMDYLKTFDPCPPPNYIIMEDIIGKMPQYKNLFEHFISSSRHYNTTVFLTTQFIMRASTLFREQTRFGFIFQPQGRNSMKHVYDIFCDSFPNYESFYEYMIQIVSQEYHAMAYIRDELPTLDNIPNRYRDFKAPIYGGERISF